MTKPIAIINANRRGILNLIEDLSLEQLNTIPTGFSNTIIWNIAHLTVTQQLLCYKLSGLPLQINQELVDEFKKGTVPIRHVDQAQFDQLKNLFITLPQQLLIDLNAGIFSSFTPYPTSAGVTLSSIDDALQFTNFHEGLHRGAIIALKKAL